MSTPATPRMPTTPTDTIEYDQCTCMTWDDGECPHEESSYPRCYTRMYDNYCECSKWACMSCPKHGVDTSNKELREHHFYADLSGKFESVESDCRAVGDALFPSEFDLTYCKIHDKEDVEVETVKFNGEFIRCTCETCAYLYHDETPPNTRHLLRAATGVAETTDTIDDQPGPVLFIAVSGKPDPKLTPLLLRPKPRRMTPQTKNIQSETDDSDQTSCRDDTDVKEDDCDSSDPDDDKPLVHKSKNPAKRKRQEKLKRTSVACLECRRTKKRCDESRPCKRCVNKGIGHLCVDASRDNNKNKKTKKNDITCTLHCFGSEREVVDLTNSKTLVYDRGYPHPMNPMPPTWF